MSTNKDLLKQAIAEAKTIREAAIANAKEALEESLTPHLKEMLALKLQEIEESEADYMEEDATINGAGSEDFSDNPGRHGNILREEEKEETEEAPEEEEEPAEEEETEEEEVEIEDMSIEDLKDLIRDIVGQELGQGEDTEKAPEGEEMVGMGDEEEININEILAELAMDEYGMEHNVIDYNGDGKVDAEDTKLAKEDVINEEPVSLATGALLAAIGVPSMVASAIGITKLVDMAKQGKFGPKAQKIADGLEKAGKVAAKTTQQQSEGVNSLNEEPVTLATGALLAAIGVPSMVASAIGITKLMDLALAGKFGPKAKGIAEKLQKAGSVAAKTTQQQSEGAYETEQELNEALATVAQLRTQLQEVNLLNAKLLYVNKVFKANNLTEGQKVNVVAAFDKAETVKEVKLVYETVSKNVSTKQPVKQAIKEHTSFASRPAGTTQKQVINEVSEAVKRMQILAGIREREI
jgi:hypothetical protein